MHNSYTDYFTVKALLAGLVVLSLFVKVARASASRLGLWRTSASGMSIINVKWGKERIRVQFPDDPSATPLRVIRDKLAEHTGLAPDRFKLIKSGAIMKDDNAPLSAYGLKPGSTIALVGSGEGVDADIPASSSSAGGSKLGHGKNQARSPPTEQSTLQSIKTELDTVRTSLEPSVTSFLSSLSSPASQSPEQPPQEDAKVTHTRLGELLLQSLLRLDAILPESEWTEVRSARKNAVKEVQALLDQLDDGWRSASSSQSS